ncbi:iron-containing redox enzyme family protein [Serratia inhibens]|uniref:iron-containing redox enzyme family protein n=1 Tax=Serratia inhibens TaxID=2338073 RepID=UPI003217BCDA
MDKNYQTTPKFVHNLWTTNEDDEYYLRFTAGLYEVEKEDARDFYKIRSYCTGHNTVAEISNKTNLPVQRIEEMVASLNEIGMVRNEIKPANEDLLNKTMQACEMWAEQVEETHLFNKFLYGDTNRNVLIGFFLETYHYIKAFPSIINAALDNTNNPELQKILTEYKQQETGHESFILSTLLKLGMKQAEVENSVPLVSTLNLISMISDLFRMHPSTVFLIAKVIESHDFDQAEVTNAIQDITRHYELAPGTLEPFFQHSQIDYELGHSQLLDKHSHLVSLADIEETSFILNAIHDIKHAIDLQCLEIEEYYSKEGNYIPRQRVDYFGI